MSSIDPLTSIIVIITISVFFLSIIMHLLKFPSVITYIFAGVIVGSHGLALVTDQEILGVIGSLGVILLLFFTGIEFSITKLVKMWKVALGASLLQVGLSIFFLSMLALFLDWPLGRLVLMSFVLTLSSTAVVIKLLQSSGEINTEIGEKVLGILIMQDILVVPMMLIISFLGGSEVSTTQLTSQAIGAVALFLLLLYAVRKGRLSLPIPQIFRKDQELQVFVALGLCFGFAFITGLLNLSTALGAFVAGLLIAMTKEAHWVQKTLHPFYVLFVALFFVSIGMLLDLTFVMEHIWLVLLLVFFTIIINGITNVLALRLLGVSWRESFYGGILLTQIGEFSFVLAGIGLATGTIGEFAYKLTLAVISLSLLISPFLILGAKFFLRKVKEEEKKRKKRRFNFPFEKNQKTSKQIHLKKA